MAERWMVYADAARILGMRPEGVRQRSRREGWAKRMGNDGKALVLVPDDAGRCLPEGTDGELVPPLAVSGRTPGRKDVNEVTALLAQIASLEARAGELRADLDRERGERERERSERLQERDRADKLTGEVADLARELARITSGAGARERELQDQIREAESTVSTMRAAPWWKRLRRA